LTYFVDIKPSIDNIKENNLNILSKQDSSIVILNDINNKYTIKNFEGEDVIIGYSSEVKMDLIKVVKCENNDLKRGDEIVLTNYIGKFRPSIQLMVEETIEPQSNTNKKVKMFVSKDAMIKLGLDKELYKGIFSVRMKRIVK
jgi:hypothetical protein